MGSIKNELKIFNKNVFSIYYIVRGICYDVYIKHSCLRLLKTMRIISLIVFLKKHHHQIRIHFIRHKFFGLGIHVALFMYVLYPGSKLVDFVKRKHQVCSGMIKYNSQ